CLQEVTLGNTEPSELEAKKKKYDEEFKLGLFGTLGFLLTVVIPLALIDEDWFKPYIHLSFFSGIAWLLVYIAAFFERNSYISELWKYNSVKFAISLAFSLLVYSSNYTASATINAVFGVDASAFPYTQIALTFLNTVLTLEVVLRVVFLVSFVMLSLSAWAYRGENKYGWLAFLLGVGYLASALTGWVFTNRYFDSEQHMKLKAYAVAHKVDFSTKHFCSNLGENKSVIFLGPQMTTVLVDNAIQLNPSIYETLKLKQEPQSIITVPSSFSIVRCIVE
ncbi:hypothetical protein, partial [Vibrio sp. LaRot3]|uniref:hypothetical protein n=1 Tax=Vibrio sp. LaRot3 TaxID=2998829 RepID=UPI0022CDEB24